MAIHNRAGQPAQQSDLINVAQLTAQYYVLKPEAGNAEHAVKFGTSGHRGSAARHSFNEPHILAIAQAIAEERAKNGITGPCYVGKDTHALSEPAFISVLEVLAANGVDVIVQENNGFTPTPAVSNAILVHNKKGGPLADGIVITPSHNPPEDGGIKYNPPNGGPADTNVTKVVEDRANALLADGLKGVKRISLDEAMASGHVKEQDLVQPFVEGLADIYQKYMDSDFYVMSSRFEGFGLVLAEAMSCGIPCVSFDCPHGPSDIIKDYEDGLLVEKENIKELADKICYLIENENVRIKMGHKARENVKRFLPENVMPQWKNLFESLTYSSK